MNQALAQSFSGARRRQPLPHEPRIESGPSRFPARHGTIPALSLRESCGLSLIEVALAMGIFAIVMTSSAQVLASFTGAMDVQEQRHMAAQHCRALLAEMRQQRDAPGVGFPARLTNVWPDGFVTQNPAFVELPNETLTVVYGDLLANPLQVTVTSRWTDRSGRLLQVSVSTLLTDA